MSLLVGQSYWSQSVPWQWLKLRPLLTNGQQQPHQQDLLSVAPGYVSSPLEGGEPFISSQVWSVSALLWFLRCPGGNEVWVVRHHGENRSQCFCFFLQEILIQEWAEKNTIAVFWMIVTRCGKVNNLKVHKRLCLSVNICLIIARDDVMEQWRCYRKYCIY